jgi:hypothetical protein
METKGYTLNGVAGRIRDLETKVGGAYYVALCFLAMNRASGKGSKAALETKIFGKDKPTSTFRNAWRIADKAFAEGFHQGHRVTAMEMGLDEAVTFAVKCLDAHRTALGVTSMKDYEAVCKFATHADIPAEAEPAAATQGTTDETATQPQVLPELNPVERAVDAMMSLSPVELVEFAARVQQRLNELHQAEPLAMAA